MPWEIVQRDGKYCVAKTPEGTVVPGGCHPTKAKATDHMRALYANVPDAKAAATPSVFVNDTGVSVTWTTANGNTIAVGDGYASTSSSSIAIGGQGVGVPSPAADPLAGGVAWAGPVAFENQMTGDGRIFAPGAITWDAASLPHPFRWVRADAGGHQQAVVIGRVDAYYRDPSVPGTVFARGVVLDGEDAPPEAGEFLTLAANGAAGGVSVDGDDAEFTIEAAEGGLEQHFSQMRLRGLTAVDIPAFIGAKIAFTDAVAACGCDDDALLAAAAPLAPPPDWFDDPHLDGPTPITITADGRVLGHLALFDTCHIGMPRGCTTPPRGGTYAYFHTGEVVTASGDPVAVGHMTFGTGHADMTASGAAAAAHYDNTGTVAADVRAGEDAHGIWLAGALRPHLSEEQVREFRAAPPSGDWRRIGGRLELVAALAVNTPGFPVPRTRARVLVASGEQQAVIATPAVGDFDLDDAGRAAIKVRLANTVRLRDLIHRVGAGG